MKYNNTNLNYMLECYQGSNSWSTGVILPRHEKESDAGYNRRCKGFVSPAIYRYLIDSYDIIFAKEPIRKNVEEESYKDFIKNAGMGLNLNNLLKLAVKRSQILGSCFLVMDSFSEQPETYEEMIKNRSFPYLEMVLPQDVKELVIDKVGKITKFTYEYRLNNLTYTRSYTPYKVMDTNNSIGYVNGIDLPVEMPIFPFVFSGEPLITNEMPSSPTVGIYQLQLNTAIIYSLSNEAMYCSQFPVLVISSTAIDTKNFVLGNNSALFLNTGDTADFICPPATAIDTMRTQIEANTTMMVKTHANLLTSGDVQSGIAKIIDRQNGVLQLKEISNKLEWIEDDIYNTYCKFMGVIPNEDYESNYDKNFDITDLSNYLSNALTLLDVNFTDEVKVKIKQDLIRKFMGSSESNETINELLDSESNNIPTDIDKTIDMPSEEDLEV